ncbi:MAG: DUF2339 domain-containing protein [Nanoarchaeota archaeon]|nr:DUF2339 domain-containing protein [Nanoarchaeota archaeon]
MPKKNQEDELKSLAEQNKEILTRLDVVEKRLGIGSLQAQPAPAAVKEETDTTGLTLIIVGGILCLTIVGIILGLPLLIWGIVRLSSKKTSAAPSAPSAAVAEKPVSQSGTGLEEKIGLKWFSTLGILALVIGIGFFIKYAIDNNWLSHLARIFVGTLIGVGLAAAGLWVSKKEQYLFWGRTLTGGGFAIAYFSCYAAYHFPEYRAAIGITQFVDIVLLSLIVILAILVSTRLSSKVIAGEAFFLGYVTSLLSNNFELTTVIYGLLLTIGLVIVVAYKKWPAMGVAGVFATYLVYIIWSVQTKTSFALSAFFLLTYFVANWLESHILGKDDANAVVLTIFNTLFFTAFAYLKIADSYTDYKGWFLVAMAFVCFGLYKWYSARNGVSRTYMYLGLLILTWFIPVQFDDPWTLALFSLETLALVVLSFRNKWFEIPSYVLSGIAFFGIMTIGWGLKAFNYSDILSSSRFLVYLVSIASFYAAYAYSKENGRPIHYLGWLASFFFVLMLALELKRYWISVGWAVFGLSILMVGFAQKNKHLRMQGAIAFAITIIKVFLYDTSELSSLYRTISFMALGVILLAASLAYAKFKDKLRDVF